MTPAAAKKTIDTEAEGGANPLAAIQGNRIGSHSFGEYCSIVERFHGSPAPGVLIGGYMVDLARQGMAEGVLFEAICETRVCLPDAIQLLTPCTTGNNRVKVVHVGRFALTLYDKVTGIGFRAFLDVSKLNRWSEIRTWFLKLKPKSEQDGVRLLEEIGAAGTSILGVEPVTVKPAFLEKSKLGPVRLCPSCGEAYPNSDGDRCGGCRGELPYL